MKVGERGSLKWIQRAINHRPDLLDMDIRSATGAESVTWLSPLADDSFAEYRDGSFLDRLGAPQLGPALKAFWPSGGPRWDALGRTSRGDLLIVEAKAHIDEICSSASDAGEASLRRIDESLVACAAAVGATPKAPWSSVFYQMTNRLAHLWFLRGAGQPAWLVFANFIGDADMKGPMSAREWEAAYRVAMHVLGLRRDHPLARYIIHTYPPVNDLSDLA